MLSKRNLDQTIESEGAAERIHLEEGGNFKVNEGSTKISGHMNTDAEKDLSNIVKQNIETSKRRKSSSRVLYDVTKPTLKTHIGHRMSKRKMEVN